MPRPIDWLYFRRSCVTCKNAQGFLKPAGVPVTETVDATKTRLGPDEALARLDGIDQLVVAKGKKLEVFDLKTARPADEELLARLMGPTGNLRAPTARVGKTLVVGFNEEAYRQVFGG
ncbi:MAG TPA: ArsC family (seleno)protein [Urbifossiella sp.]|jgi:arsenate reductase-like glutaredoxin family protein|nr:ArsC family (seleno)protein [Urbifossiella sp.]